VRKQVAKKETTKKKVAEQQKESARKLLKRKNTNPMALFKEALNPKSELASFVDHRPDPVDAIFIGQSYNGVNTEAFASDCPSGEVTDCVLEFAGVKRANCMFLEAIKPSEARIKKKEKKGPSRVAGYH
jgi:hypothetical protein